MEKRSGVSSSKTCGQPITGLGALQQASAAQAPPGCVFNIDEAHLCSWTCQRVGRRLLLSLLPAAHSGPCTPPEGQWYRQFPPQRLSPSLCPASQESVISRGNGDRKSTQLPVCLLSNVIFLTGHFWPPLLLLGHHILQISEPHPLHDGHQRPGGEQRAPGLLDCKGQASSLR